MKKRLLNQIMMKNCSFLYMVERKIAVMATSRGKKTDKAGSITFIGPNFVIRKGKVMFFCFRTLDTNNNLLIF